MLATEAPASTIPIDTTPGMGREFCKPCILLDVPGSGPKGVATVRLLEKLPRMRFLQNFPAVSLENKGPMVRGEWVKSQWWALRIRRRCGLRRARDSDLVRG